MPLRDIREQKKARDREDTTQSLEIGMQPPALKSARLWVALMLAIGLGIRIMISFQPLEFHLHGPLVDDAFYSMKIAKNLASGLGFTFDGIHKTNGFQPLYVFLMAPVFKFISNDTFIPIKIALAMLSIFNIVTGYFLFRMVRRKYGDRTGLFALGLWCFSPYVIYHGLCGLETSIAAFFIILTLDHYLTKIRGAARIRKNDLILSLLIALLVFTRIDGALFALALGLDYMLYGSEADPTFRKRLARMAMIAAGALLIYSPWLIFSQAQFGSIMPVSGRAVRHISQLYGSYMLPLDFPHFEPGHAPALFYLGNLKKTLQVLAQNPLFFPASTLSYILKTIGIHGKIFFLDSWPVHLLFILAGLALFRIIEKDMDGLIIFVIIFLAAYNFYTFGSWFFDRYFYPVEMIFIVMAAGIFNRMDQALRRKNFRLILPFIAILFIPVFCDNAVSTFGKIKGFNIIYHYTLTKAIDKVTPESARVGTFQAGTMGYFSSRVIINLDGVVNEEALESMKEKRLLEYLEQERIDFVVDEANFIQLLLFRCAGGDIKERLVKVSSPDLPIEMYEVKVP